MAIILPMASFLIGKSLVLYIVLYFALLTGVTKKSSKDNTH